MITYHSVKEMLMADDLSRQEKNNCNQVNLDVRIKFIQVSTRKLKESSNDSVISALREQIFIGWPDKAKDMPKILKPHWSFKDKLSAEDLLVLKEDRILIPSNMRSENLNKIHIAARH